MMNLEESSNKTKKIARLIIIILFLTVPILSSFISTMHLIDFFSLGNYTWMSFVLAFIYEIGSIASFIVPFVLINIRKNLIWTIFIVLAFMQIFGNIYFSFNFINLQLLHTSNWLDSFQELISYFVGKDIALIKIIVSFMIGIPIPLISLFFLKSLVDYINPSNNSILTNNIDKPETNIKNSTIPEIYNNEISNVVGDNSIRKKNESSLEKMLEESQQEIEEKIKLAQKND